MKPQLRRKGNTSHFACNVNAWNFPFKISSPFPYQMLNKLAHNRNTNLIIFIAKTDNLPTLTRHKIVLAQHEVAELLPNTMTNKTIHNYIIDNMQHHTVRRQLWKFLSLLSIHWNV